MPLIGSVTCTPQSPLQGQSLLVQVLAPDGTSYSAQPGAVVVINGVTGAEQYLQFEYAGKHRLLVSLSLAGQTESVEQAIDIIPVPHPKEAQAAMPVEHRAFHMLWLRPEIGLPMLRIARSPHEPYSMGFSVGQRRVYGDGLVTGPGAGQPRINRARTLGAQGSAVRSATGVPADFAGILDTVAGPPQAPDTPVFDWDFGDGTTATSTDGYIQHDFAAALDADTEHRTFHVRARVRQPGEDPVEVVRTVSVFSAYVMCKRMGTLVPKVRSSGFARRVFHGSTGSFTVDNIEAFPLVLTSRRVAATAADGSAPDLLGPPEELAVPIEVPAAGSALVSVTVGSAQLPRDAAGFSVVYAGQTSDGLPIRVEAEFDIATNDRGNAVKLGDLALTHFKPFRDALASIRDAGPRPVEQERIRLADGVGAESFATVRHGSLARMLLEPGAAALTHVAVEPPAAIVRDAHLISRRAGREQVLETPVAGVPALRERLFATLDDTSVRVVEVLGDTASLRRSDVLGEAVKSSMIDLVGLADLIQVAPVEGATCDPDNVPDDTGDWVCQATGETKERIVPGRFTNARKGDIVLSPGGSGPIGGLLRQVSPPQKYSHCGIMTGNYDRITHSTASEERIEAYPVGVELDGDLQPTEGHRPDILKYAWPGVVTQGVEQAIYGEPMLDPETAGLPDDQKKWYTISSFSPYAQGMTLGQNFEVVPPLVVKPDPMVETPELRRRLHRIADAAAASAGRSHYRFFCYTDPTIGSTTVAPAEAGWAAGTFPSVCSSFVWMMLKRAGVHLESDSATVAAGDLEAADIGHGAEIDGATPDGLYLYTAQERRAAADFLFTTLQEKVAETLSDKAGALSGVIDLFSDIADDVANQMVNAFASDWTDTAAKDSQAWQDVAAARAVSPDNIAFWDGPDRGGLYGYTAPAHYREARIETLPVSCWTKVVSRGDLHGTVRYNGAAVATAMVQLYDGMTTFTDGAGGYRLTGVPLGAYSLTAAKDDTVMLTARQPVTLSEADTTVDIELHGPSDMFREVVVDGTLHIEDFEDFGSDEVVDRAFHRALHVGPYHTHDETMIVEKMGGEVRVEVRIVADWQLNRSVHLWWEVNFFEGDSEDSNDLDGHTDHAFDLAIDSWQSWKSSIRSGGAGAVEMNVVFANNINPS